VSSLTGLSWIPSWHQVIISSSSSIVPYPPGSRDQQAVAVRKQTQFWGWGSELLPARSVDDGYVLAGGTSGLVWHLGERRRLGTDEPSRLSSGACRPRPSPLPRFHLISATSVKDRRVKNVTVNLRRVQAYITVTVRSAFLSQWLGHTYTHTVPVPDDT
jgi:hypothetical protein